MPSGSGTDSSQIDPDPGELSPEAMLAARRAFLQISEEDCQRVRALARAFSGFADEFVERFYAHLFANPSTAAFLTDPELVERLKRTQKQYFENLLACQLDAEYVAGRKQVGLAHAQIGLDPEWFLGAFNQYIQQCFRYFAEHATPNLEGYVESTLSLIKLILLDIGLTLDAYFAQSTEQLHRALQLLDRSNAELREFARLASHDLKTPLGTVAGLCEEFLDEFGEQVPAEGRALIEAARNRTLSLGRVLDELLSLSEAGSEPEQRTQLSTRGLLDEVLERLRSEIGNRDVEVLVPDQMPDVHTHPGRVREVFYNLLSNAVKFLDKQPGRIRITSNQTDSEITFCVSDNGPGIPEAQLSKVFAPFHRLVQHRDQPGSGLGLYFVKMLVEKERGRVWAQSKLGEGSQFFFVLPRNPAGPKG